MNGRKKAFLGMYLTIVIMAGSRDVELDLGGPVTFGSYRYITDAFKLLGCTHAYEETRSEWLTPELSSVPGTDPDLIVYEPKMYSAFKKGDVDSLVRDRGWDGMRAVKFGERVRDPRTSGLPCRSWPVLYH